MKVYKALANDLLKFEGLEDFEKQIIADYIDCPSSEDCKYDGGNDHSCCTECKIKYLESEW